VLFIACACSNADSAPTRATSNEPATPVERTTTTTVETPREQSRTPHSARVTRLGDPHVTARITKVHIAAAISGADSAATRRPVYARANQTVTLYAVIDTDHGTFSDAPGVHGKPLSAGPAIELAWRRVEPAKATMSNEDGGSFHFEQIEYRATDLDVTGGAITADVRPTLTPDYGHGVGTMRYQLAVTQGDRTIASPGPEARRGRGSGGLVDDVMRVTIRRDDTYLGYLTELYGQPYIWASAGITDASHQSERLEGADCADFVIYGRRRMGKDVAYTWTGGLPDLTKLLGNGTRGADGVYRDKAGKPIPSGAPGDLLLFPRHVGVLVEDRGTIGVLDDKDLIVHALFDTPHELAIADSGYADTTVELRRFR